MVNSSYDYDLRLTYLLICIFPYLFYHFTFATFLFESLYFHEQHNISKRTHSPIFPSFSSHKKKTFQQQFDFKVYKLNKNAKQEEKKKFRWRKRRLSCWYCKWYYFSVRVLMKAHLIILNCQNVFCLLLSYCWLLSKWHT